MFMSPRTIVGSGRNPRGQSEAWLAKLDFGTPLAGDFNTDGIVERGVQNNIPILLLFVGIGIIAGARKGRMSENAMTITNVMLGCAVIAGAAFFYGFADNIANFVFRG